MNGNAPERAPLRVEGAPFPSWRASARCADPLTLLAAAAAVTDTIRLGASVIVVPLHIPIQLAKALATIDGLSGEGRLIAGLGTGTPVPRRGAGT